MKRLYSIFISLVLNLPIFSQSIEGDYFIETSNGKISLSLSTLDQIQYSGKMIGDEGSIFTVVAQSDQQGGILGTLSGTQAELGFAAYLEDRILNVVLAPIGANGQPDYNQGQRFLMNQAESRDEDSAKLSGPLMNSVTGSTWNGTYYGDIGGTKSSLTLQQQNTTVQGRIDAGGYIYNLSGILTNEQLDGELVDPQTQGRMACKGSLQQGVIHLTLNDPQTGQSIRMSFSNNPGDATGTGSMNGDVSTSVNTERDPNLIGNWLYSESYTSGSYSFASQWRLIVNADGTYLYGDAKMAGGGPGSSGQSGGGDYTRGQWKTQNKTIYINEGYGWQPYAGYYIEGNSMLMKFEDGSKQVWKRY